MYIELVHQLSSLILKCIAEKIGHILSFQCCIYNEIWNLNEHSGPANTLIFGGKTEQK